VERSDLPLRGKVVLILGGGRGLGRSIALGASRLGAHVAVASRSKPDLEALQRDIERETGASPLVIVADVRDTGAVEAAVETTRGKWGRVDAGVYNAGVGYWEAVTEMPEERWDETLDTNLKGAFLFTRVVLPVMLAQRRGQLVYVSSRLAAEPLVRYAAYCASKAGLRAFAEVVAKEAGDRGIRVTTVLPGLIDTGFSDGPHRRPRDRRPPQELMLSADEVADQILQVIRAPDNAWVKELFVYPARL
jgi:3-oxoacyl-[acyl-carrier protein] reductase